MSKLQFVSILVTAISSFVLVVLAWMQSNVRMSRIEALLDAMVGRQSSDIEAVRNGMSADKRELMERMAADKRELRESFAADMKEVRERLTTIDNHLMTFYTVTGRLEGRIDELSRR